MRYDLVVGDLQPPIQETLAGITGPLPDGVTATFSMRQADGTKTVTGAATIIDPTALTIVVSYQWVTGDTTTAGTYRGRMKLIYANGPESFPPDEPFWIVIHAP